MTTIVVPLDPPRPGLACPALGSEAGPLTDAEAATLYGAMARDALAVADRAGSDLVVAYPPDDDLPQRHATGTPVEAAVRALTVDALPDRSAVRFVERDAVAGVVDRLLGGEATSVGVLRPTAPLTTRTVLDAAAMKSRSAGVVVGPAPDGRVHYAVVATPVDLAGAFDPPALRTLVDRAVDAGVDADFVEMRPVVERPGDLSTLVTLLDARRRADRRVPAHTAGAVDDLDLSVTVDGGRPVVER